MRTRVLVADDHPMYRRAVARAISARPDLELVAEAGDGTSALEMIRELDPDVALLDVEMPKLDGFEVLRRVSRARLKARVILLTGSPASEPVHEALAAGARGYLIKTAGGDTVCDAVAAVMRGQTVLSPDVQHELAGEIRDREGAATPLLSGRELEILRLTASGLTASEVAAETYISENTVRSHLRNAYDKLGVSDKAAAVAQAMRLGLID